jgi:hypothetical protein
MNAAGELSVQRLASCLPRLRLRVFHTAVRYGKRHVKLIETSAEERVNKCKNITTLFRIPLRKHGKCFSETIFFEPDTCIYTGSLYSPRPSPSLKLIKELPQ